MTETFTSRIHMSHETLHFENQDQVRTLAGYHDEWLKLVRDRIGVRVILRGGELTLSGDDARVEQARKVFTELRAIIRKHGELDSSEVERILARHGAVVPAEETELSQTRSQRYEAAPINLFEQAKRVAPRSDGQKQYIEAIQNNDLVFCSGPAGCGKTYLSVAMALNWLRTERVRKIVLVRPAVEAGEKLGFLPGDFMAKINPYLRPLLDALEDILNFEQVRRYLEHDIVEIVPLAFMRGRTLNDTFIILDEAQNTTVTQMKMFLTRMGENSKIVVTGDPTQSDLPSTVRSGLADAIHRLHPIPGVAVVELSGQDIVRHRLVREIVRAYDQGSNGRSNRQ